MIRIINDTKLFFIPTVGRSGLNNHQNTGYPLRKKCDYGKSYGFYNSHNVGWH